MTASDQAPGTRGPGTTAPGTTAPRTTEPGTTEPGTTERMPAIYLSHGAPPLADDALWTRQLADWSRELPKPKSVLMVSAHWEVGAARARRDQHGAAHLRLLGL